jgi:group II intron reverse transcriptase/maturase
MKKTDKREKSYQMYLQSGEEWTGIVPIQDGIAVSYAERRLVEECGTDRREKIALTSKLLEEIVSLKNLERALKRVKSNKGGAGVDGMTTEELGNWFSTNWKGLQEELLKGSYKVGKVKGIKIPKPKGGYRQLGIPTVKDRLVQQAIHQVLEPLYDKDFSPTSYGFRKGRRASQAIEQLSHYISQDKAYVIDLDLSKFFDEVHHNRLLSRLSRRIGDKRLLRLIHLYLKAGILENGISHQRIKGTPQGSPLSPLLSNIVLDELDKELSHRGHTYVRYADDIIIVVGSQRSAERVNTSIITFIEEVMKLEVNRTKSRICAPRELNYLGHRFGKDGGIYLSSESENRLKEKIRQVTKRNRGRSLEQIVSELNSLLRGWLHYFRKAKMKNKLMKIESWLQRRIRCYRLKQCKRPIGIMRFLHRLGVPKNRAWTTAVSRKGWWRKALTPASHEGMNRKWFNNIGLYNLTHNYSLLHT